MRRIVICNGKGGVGKSTVTMLLALALHQAKKSVAIQDLDPQGSVEEWVKGWMSQGLVEENLMFNRNREPDVLITDTPGKSEMSEHIQQIPKAHLYLIPTTPAFEDQRIAQKTITTIRSIHKDAPIKLLFNRLDPRAKDARSIEKNAQALGVPYLKNTIHQRKCYAYAQLGAWETINAEASNEMLNLALEIL